MTFTFLGTGTSGGIPVVGCHCEVCRSTDSHDKRLRTSLMIRSDTTCVIIDSGPDFRYQMLREKVDCVDAIVFTHEHRDHIAGLDDIRSLNWIQKKPIPLYASIQVQTAIKTSFPYIFSKTDYPGLPKINFHTINSHEAFTIGDICLQPILVMHHKLPVLGFRIGDFTYITDANYISAEEKEKIKNSRVLVLNALRRKPHISHFTLNEALKMIKELNPDLAYLTHLSHQLEVHKKVEKELPSGVHLAFDGLNVTI